MSIFVAVHPFELMGKSEEAKMNLRMQHSEFAICGFNSLARLSELKRSVSPEALESILPEVGFILIPLIGNMRACARFFNSNVTLAHNSFLPNREEANDVIKQVIYSIRLYIIGDVDFFRSLRGFLSHEPLAL